MTPNEFYNLPPIKTTKEIYDLYSLFKILDIDEWHYRDADPNEKVELRVLADHSYDERRGWYMASVWFEDKPVMIIRLAGRENDDHKSSFVTDIETYKRMVWYIKSLMKLDVSDIVENDPNENIPDLTSFYGDDLYNLYSPKMISTNYKVGDIVIANVIENHLSYKSMKVHTRCKIISVNNRHPTKTYEALRLDDIFNKELKIVKKKNKGYIYTVFSESDVIGYSP